MQLKGASLCGLEGRVSGRSRIHYLSIQKGFSDLTTMASLKSRSFAFRYFLMTSWTRKFSKRSEPGTMNLKLELEQSRIRSSLVTYVYKPSDRELSSTIEVRAWSGIRTSDRFQMAEDLSAGPPLVNHPYNVNSVICRKLMLFDSWCWISPPPPKVCADLFGHSLNPLSIAHISRYRRNSIWVTCEALKLAEHASCPSTIGWAFISSISKQILNHIVWD